MGDLFILNLETLDDLSQLSSVNFFGQDLAISRTAITDLNDIRIESDSMSIINLTSNPSLVDLSNLASLTQLGTIYLWQNDALSSLAGFEQLERVNAELDFRGQPQLLDFSELVNLEYVYDFELFRTYFQDLSGLENLSLIHI